GGVHGRRVHLHQLLVSSVGLLRYMDEEVRLVVGVGLLEIAVGLDALEADFPHQPAHVILPKWIHVQVVVRPVWERVAEPCQPLVDVHGLGGDILAAVVVGVLAGIATVQDCVVVPLVDDQDAVMLEHRVELGQRLAPVAFREQVGEGVAQTDNGVVLAVHIPVEPAPVGVHHTQDVTAVGQAVGERTGQHLRAAVRTDRLEPFLQQPYRVEPGAGGHVEYLADAAGLQLVDEEAALAFRPPLPVDQFVPLLDETGHVLGDVMVGLAYLKRPVPEVLYDIGILNGPGGEVRRGLPDPVVVWSHARSRVFRQRTARMSSPTVTLTLTARYIESAAGQPWWRAGVARNGRCGTAGRTTCRFPTSRYYAGPLRPAARSERQRGVTMGGCTPVTSQPRIC